MIRADPPTAEAAQAFLKAEREGDVQALAEGWTRDPDDRALRVDWTAVEAVDTGLARGILQHPEDATDAFQEALSAWKEILNAAVIRFRNLPDDRTFRVGDLRTQHLGSLVAVQCEVVDVKPVRPLVTEAAFECAKCGTITYLSQTYGALYKPDECMGCEATKQEGFFRFIEEQSELVDHQPIVVTPLESTLDDPPAVFVYLLHDLCGTVGEEDELTVNGVYRTLPLSMQDSVRFDVFIEASDIDVEERAQADKMTESELTELVLAETREQMTEDGSSYGAGKTAVIDAVASEHGVRPKEVRDCIGRLEDENQIAVHAGRITVGE